MPSRRKNKAPPKPLAAASQAKSQPAGEIRHSSIKRRRSSLSLKTSTSRLQPSEPLHMTTRGAAKAASDHTSPAAPSITNGSSRRTSLDSVAHLEDQQSDFEDERPAKRSRATTDSGSPPNQRGNLVSPLPAGDDVGSKAVSRATSNTSKASTRKRRPSAESSDSSKTAAGLHPNGGVARSESDLSEKQPRRKKRKLLNATPEPHDGPPELTDGSSPAGSPEAIPDVASSQGLQNALPATNGDVPAKTARRRLPGRRRQPHSDVNVETHLRRQLGLKMGYRSLAKIQKAFLSELSTRTTTNLENDVDFHKESPEYQHVMAQLDQRRQSRIDQINADHRLKLEQLERVRAAEESIQKEQYINRFKEMQNDMLMQCYYHVKQIRRQAKIAYEDATDDEDNLIDPAFLEFPANSEDDRVGSRYASRSRAYIETDRMIQEDELRSTFGQQCREFMMQNNDPDDAIDEIPGGFAAFSGPNRSESLAHYRVAALVDAADELEKASLEPEPVKVIANEQADALYLLASISSERPSEIIGTKAEHDIALARPLTTPTHQDGLQRGASPVAPRSAASTAMSLESAATGKGSPMRSFDVKEPETQFTEPPITITQDHEKLELVPRKTATPVRATNRIMDLLNDEPPEIPGLRSRDPDTGTRDAASGRRPPSAYNIDCPAPSQSQPSPQQGSVRFDKMLHSDPYPRPRTAEIANFPYRRSQSPAHGDGLWSSTSMRRPSEPLVSGGGHSQLNRIKLMLDQKAERNGVQQRDEAFGVERQKELPAQHAIVDRPGMAPPTSRPYSPSEKSTTSKNPQGSSVSAYSPQSSNAPFQYEQSPRERHIPYTSQHHRQSSLDQVPRPHWGNRRQSNGSQVPQSQAIQHAGSPKQQHSYEIGRSIPTPPPRQSPYVPPSTLTHPTPGTSQSSKPQGPTVFRFAHYDPAPPKLPPSQQSASQASTTQQPPSPAPPHPMQYPYPYASQPHYQGYIPPPGSFQAPPPPLPHINASSPYPPLKIHQYGGQPILPANMAPIPPSGPITYRSSPPAPAFAQPSHPPHASPPGARPPFEITHAPGPPASAPPHERPDNGPRPRRAYRSYHAPGTEFRNYQGPNQRRRPT